MLTCRPPLKKLLSSFTRWRMGRTSLSDHAGHAQSCRQNGNRYTGNCLGACLISCYELVWVCVFATLNVVSRLFAGALLKRSLPFKKSSAGDLIQRFFSSPNG